MLLVVPLAPVRPQPPPDHNHLLDFRPVWRNRPALAYILGYTVHCWELFGMRAWIVAFLAFSLTLAPAPGAWSPTTVATAGALVAMVASIVGADLAARVGRPRLVIGAMLSSAACSAAIGFLAGSPYVAVAVFSLVYAAAVQLDSAVLTTGAVQAATAGLRGATLALHSLLGFGAAFLGPVAVGWVLDLAGGRQEVAAWGMAFASLAAVGLLGPLAMLLTRAPDARPMKHAALRLLRLTAGYLLLFVGVLGLFLPVLQGVLFLALGLAILQHETAWGKRLNARLRRRFPGTFARADNLYLRARQRLRRLPRPWRRRSGPD